MLKGSRTLILGVLVAVVPAAISGLTSIQTGVSPLYAALIGVAIIALRYGQQKSWDIASWGQFLLGLGLALVPGLLTLVDVIKEIDGLPSWAAMAVGVAGIGLKLVTNTPMGQKQPVA